MSAPMDHGRSPSTGAPGLDLMTAVDLVAGATVVAAVTASIVTRRSVRLVRGVARTLPLPRLRSPMRPGSGLASLAHLGEEQRRSLESTVSALLDQLVPAVAEAAMQRLDLTALITKYVELDELVGTVNLDQAVAGVDIDAIAARIDIDAVISRVDLVGLTEEILNAIDITEVIRESTTSVASDGVREVRMQSISADEAIARVIDRFRPRKQHRPDGVAAQVIPAETTASVAAEPTVIVLPDAVTPSPEPGGPPSQP